MCPNRFVADTVISAFVDPPAFLTILKKSRPMSISDLNSLLCIPIIVGGFFLRINPLLVVTVAAIATGISVGMKPLDLLELFGEKFSNNRFLAIYILLLPVVGLLESKGLKEVVQLRMSRGTNIAAERVLIFYLVFRYSLGAMGANYLAGHVQTVRPLLAPLTIQAAENEYGTLPAEVREKISSYAIACENIGSFFGSHIFAGFGGNLLMVAFLHESGITSVSPLSLALWSAPIALVGFLIQMVRIVRLKYFIHRAIDQRITDFS